MGLFLHDCSLSVYLPISLPCSFLSSSLTSFFLLFLYGNMLGLGHLIDDFPQILFFSMEGVNTGNIEESKKLQNQNWNLHSFEILQLRNSFNVPPEESSHLSSLRHQNCRISLFFDKNQPKTFNTHCFIVCRE